VHTFIHFHLRCKRKNDEIQLRVIIQK